MKLLTVLLLVILFSSCQPDERLRTLRGFWRVQSIQCGPGYANLCSKLWYSALIIDNSEIENDNIQIEGDSLFINHTEKVLIGFHGKFAFKIDSLTKNKMVLKYNSKNTFLANMKFSVTKDAYVILEKCNPSKKIITPDRITLISDNGIIIFPKFNLELINRQLINCEYLRYTRIKGNKSGRLTFLQKKLLNKLLQYTNCELLEEKPILGVNDGISLDVFFNVNGKQLYLNDQFSQNRALAGFLFSLRNTDLPSTFRGKIDNPSYVEMRIVKNPFTKE